jgi:predicted regulator of Ras-like GTPase activity (Roadblock/LC7/MglB family)
MDIAPGEHYISTGLILSAEQAGEIDRILAEVRSRTPATLVVLTARDGQFISASGDNLQRMDLVGLSSLIAGDLAASHQIAQLSGVYEDYQIVLREGHNSHLLVADAGPQMALFMLVPSTVPVGWARLLGRESARELAKIGAVAGKTGEILPRGTSADLASEFDKALGDLWNG